MLIGAGYTIAFEAERPTPLTLMLDVHPTREPDLVTPDVMRFDRPVDARRFRDTWDNRCTRIVVPAGRLEISADFEIEDDGRPDPVAPSAVQHDVPDLPDDVLQFLLGSRYCDTDLMSDLAWSELGSTPTGWARVQTVCDFAHERIRFDYEDADATRTAFGAYHDRKGVCRDFAHLAVTLCRCLNIPARYCTGYLGDIGVPADPNPMDFSAWFEAYLGGRWYAFDARRNVPRIGRIVMARGRDAADVAISTSFGATTLAGFEVRTREIVTPHSANPARPADGVLAAAVA